jgi:outer membrane protein OmpA-like peptidoglycan-associated protein
MTHHRLFASAASIVVGLSASVAHAQSFDPHVDTQTFRIAPGPNNFLVTDGARVDGQLAFSVGAFADYANRPVAIFNATCPNASERSGCMPTTLRSVPIAHLATLQLMGSVTFARRIQVGLSVPIAFEQGDDVDEVSLAPAAGTHGQVGGGLGDPRLSVKVRILGEGMSGPALAVAVFGQIPLARWLAPNVYFMGDTSALFGGHVIGEFRRGPLALAANVGVAVRPTTIQLLDDSVSHRLYWSLAASVDVTPRVVALVDYFGSTDLLAPFTEQNASEIDAAIRYRIGDLALTAGGGAGLARFVGTPVARGFLGAVYAPNNVDTDHDGLRDDRDRCPTEAEDADGFQDDDGCPDPDNDGDHFPDARDRCPNEPEDRDNFRDDDGCPDRDNDNDGIADGYDSCPNQPEDRDGDTDDDGCPDNDRDRDGITDDRDRCPTDPEDTDGFEDEDGCPDPDNDHDGIPDRADQCEQPETFNGFQDDDGCPDVLPDVDHDGIPDGADHCPSQAETYNGFEDADGCPDRGRSLVRLENNRIQILQQVNFATNSDRIVGAPSFRVLDSVAAVMAAHPELGVVDVQGHTDDRGNADANRDLSLRRAQSVVAYLVAHHVQPARLVAHGFGPDQPLEPNTNARARARNRRVEFHVLGPAASSSSSSAAAP